MNIISDFKDFYDQDTFYDQDKGIEYKRIPKYIADENLFNEIIESIPIRRAQNLLKKYKRWTETYSRPMEGGGYYMTFEYHVVGIFPYVYLVPLVAVYKFISGKRKNSTYLDQPVEYFYKDPTLPFNSDTLREIGNKYGMDFIQYKGKGPNKKPLHRVILRKFTDIEGSFFYLEEYISPDDIVIESPENLKSPDFRELFHMIGSPLFYMSSYSNPKHSQIQLGPWNTNSWTFSIDPDFSEINYISLQLFQGEGNICSRIEEFLVEHSNPELYLPSTSQEEISKENKPIKNYGNKEKSNSIRKRR